MPRQVRRAVLVSYAAFVFVGVSAGSSGVLLPSQMTSYSVDRATIGLIFFASSAGYFLAGMSTGARVGLRASLTRNASRSTPGGTGSSVMRPAQSLPSRRSHFGGTAKPDRDALMCFSVRRQTEKRRRRNAEFERSKDALGPSSCWRRRRPS